MESAAQDKGQIIFRIGENPYDPQQTQNTEALDEESQQRLKQVQMKQQEKEKQRLQVRQDKTEEQVKEKDPEEDFKLINLNFQKQLQEILAKIEGWKALGQDKEQLEKFFDNLYGEHRHLREYVANYSYSVPTYQLQQCERQLENLYDKITEQKDQAFPKKKFAFVRKQAPKSKEETKQTGPSSQEATQQSQLIINNSQGNHLLIKDIYNQDVRRTAQEYSGKENVIIEGLENCNVYLPFAIKSMYVKNIKDCRVFVGAVSGASFINSAINCEIHLCSHQIRIHNSDQTKFFLIAKSSPIIEHCKNMLFGIYNCTYENHEADLKQSHLFEIKNLYDQVLDFNWLKQDKSPNWNSSDEILEEKIRID